MKKVALVGYCFGGPQVLELISASFGGLMSSLPRTGMHGIKLATQTDLLDVVAIAHPGPVWIGDYAHFRQPASFVVADEGGAYLFLYPQDRLT